MLITPIIFIPAVGALVLALLPREQVRLIRWTAVAFAAVPLVLGLIMFFTFDRTVAGPQFVEKVPWIPAVGVQYYLGVDGIGMPMLFLTTLTVFLCTLGAFHIETRIKEFNILVLLLGTSVAGVFSSLDFFLFFLFWELELIPMYLLILVWGTGRKEYSAIKFIIYSILGSAFLLVGIIALYWAMPAPRNFEMLAMTQGLSYASPFRELVWLALFVGFAIKIPLFPFHTWLPDAHVDAPTVGSVILAGLLLKMGGYGLIRLGLNVLPDATMYFRPLILVLAVISILYGAFVAMSQTDLKKMVAYSSVSHMGFVALGVAAGSAMAITGANLVMFSHGLITGALFFLVGAVYMRTHTRVIADMGGLGTAIPRITVLWMMAGLASLGLPGMSGFISELLVFLGTFRVQQTMWWAVAAVPAIVLTAAYIMRMLQRVFFGPIKPEFAHLKDAGAFEIIPYAVLIGGSILIGVWPPIILDVINPTVLKLVESAGGLLP